MKIYLQDSQQRKIKGRMEAEAVEQELRNGPGRETAGSVTQHLVPCSSCSSEPESHRDTAAWDLSVQTEGNRKRWWK